jgi:hypothetical protein
MVYSDLLQLKNSERLVVNFGETFTFTPRVLKLVERSTADARNGVIVGATETSAEERPTAVTNAIIAVMRERMRKTRTSMAPPETRKAGWCSTRK